MRAILASSLLFLTACGPELLVAGNGIMKFEKRQVNGTTGVRLSVPGTLLITLGATPSLRIDAEENLLPYIDSNVVLGELQITDGNVSLRPTQTLRFELTVPSLEAIAISVPGSVTAPALRATDFSLSTSSAGSIHLDGLEASSLAARLSSSGSISIDTGVVTSQDLRLSSSGSFMAPGLQSTRTTATLSSSGSAVIWVTDRLEAWLTSSGNVRYAGSPQVFAHLTSSGTVRPISN